jgi:hypothetical protein
VQAVSTKQESDPKNTLAGINSFHRTRRLKMTFRNPWVPIGMLALSAFSSVAVAQEKPTIYTIDAPGAGTGAGQGSQAVVVSPSGMVMGFYADANSVFHGFLRSPQGAFTTIDVPGSGTGPGQGTLPESMNVWGEITGGYVDSSGASHGFVRSPDGEIVTFDAPGSGSGSCSAPGICASGTQGAGINPEGVVSGQYPDRNGAFHGFVRSRRGAIESFDAPGAGTGPSQGTYVTFTDGINPVGAIAGAYADASGVFHGFVRNSDGTITTFDPPGSVNTNNSGIALDGTVTSFYNGASLVYHGYIRAPDGAFTFFDVAGAGTGAYQGTEPLNINARRDITGAYVDTNGVNHGFLRYSSGAITKFSAVGAGTGSGQGTIPYYNNQADAICGTFIDANGTFHGFLRTAPGEE